MVRRALIGLLLVAPALGSCIQYNEDCSPLIANPEQVVGELAQDVDITKNTVRTTNDIFGQLVAESYSAAPDGGFLAQVGMENSGDIRSSGECESFDTLPAGPVERTTMAQVLPFNDNVGAITVDPLTLKRIFEHSVAGLVNSTTVVPNTPSGQFLQIAGVLVSVDCTLPAEAPPVDGQRVTQIVLVDAHEQPGGLEVYDADAGFVSSAPIRIATNSFILSGEDGYSMISALDAGAIDAVALPGLTFEVASAWFAQQYLGNSQHPPLGATLADGGLAQPSGGWVMTSCR
jgi:2',3'-cyclic-nucleotide 2'-phosphodiesterase (5'-nucleotidase family)